MSRTRIILLITAVMVVVSLVSSGALSRRSEYQSQKFNQKQFLKHIKPEEVTHLPSVSSRIKGLEIVSATISDLATPQAALVAEVRNNTDLAVTCLNFFTQSTDKVDMASPHDDGLDNPNELQVLIPPHSSKLFKWPTTALLDLQFPVAITAVTFVDNSGTVIEMGDPFMQKVYQEERERSKAQRKAAKAAEVQQ